MTKFSRITIYSYKFSKKTYNQHQLLVLLLLKEYLETDYREFVEIVELMNSIKEELDLDQSFSIHNIGP
jgi:hypothetical protein